MSVELFYFAKKKSVNSARYLIRVGEVELFYFDEKKVGKQCAIYYSIKCDVAIFIVRKGLQFSDTVASINRNCVRSHYI